MKAFARGLVGLFATALMLFGLTITSASAAPAAPTAPRAVSAAGSHPWLACRDHTAASTPVSGKVVVPRSYCYDPDTSIHPAWHDYCTKSPDQPPVDTFWHVDFRGPCAHHDMCLQAGHSHGYCDPPLLADMKQNCRQRFGLVDPRRYDCYGVAYLYYAAVRVFG